MFRPAVEELDKEGACPICKQEIDDQRHVSVECFYDVHEVAPDAKKMQVLVEVAAEGSYWGITRRYPEGTRDRPVVSGGGGVRPVTEISMEQDPIPPVRLLEKTEYAVTCCKSCRGDFLRAFGLWASGGMVKSENSSSTGNIAIREHGAIRYITDEEWETRRRERGHHKDG